MSIDEKVVEMRFDNKQFESNVQTSMSTLDKLKQSLNFSGAVKGFENINDVAKGCDMSPLSSSIETVKLKFSALEVMAVTALTNITNSAISFGKSIISSLTIDPITTGFQEYETQINAVQTILANTQSRQVTASKETISAINDNAAATLEATETYNEAALKSLKETQKEAVEAYEDAADEELDILEKKYKSESEALDDSLDNELSSLKSAHEEKLALYEEEYLAKLKVIDEEKYNRIQAIDAEIDGINALTESEEKALKKQKEAEKISELQAKINSSKTDEERIKAEKKLAEYKAEIARDQLLEERKAQIAALEDSKDSINEEYDLKEAALKAEYDEKTLQENELYGTKVKNLKEETDSKTTALKETYDLEKSLLKETQKAKKEALEAQQEAETAALKKQNELAVSNIKSQAALKISSLSSGEVEMTKGSTLEDVNNALDELNRYADKTIYNFTEMTKNIGTFTAAGVDLDTSVSAIQGIANLAAVSGSTSQQASTAMYQLSQALSSGTVKLMDWNSVVNAGMGGQVFQDALKETARVHGIAIDEMIAEEGSFRETLQKGWLTSDILTETLSKFTVSGVNEYLAEYTGLSSDAVSEMRDQAASSDDVTSAFKEMASTLAKNSSLTEDQIYNLLNMSTTAEDAATKVKTFTQLFDTLKEAAQSGWTESWEIIIGDFDEAKSLLTKASDVIGKMIGDSATVRNNILEGWKVYGGRDDIIKSFENIFDGVMSVVKPVKEAFANIFPDTTSQHLVIFTRKITDLTSNLTLSEEQAKNLKTTFEGIFSIFDIAGQAITAIINSIKPLFGDKYDFAGWFLKATAAIGDFVKGIDESIRKNKIFINVSRGLSGIFEIIATLLTSIFEGISNITGNKVDFGVWIGEITGKLADWLDNLKELIQKNKVFQKVIEVVIEVIKSAIDWIKTAVSKVKELIDAFLKIPAVQDAIEKLKTALSNFFEKGISIENFRDAFSKLPDIVKGAFGNIGGIFSSFGQDTGTVFGNITGVFTTFGDKVKGIFAGIGDNTSSFGDKIKSVFDNIKTAFSSFGEGIGDKFANFGDLFDSIKEKAKSFLEFLKEKFSGVNISSIIGVGVGIAVIKIAKNISEFVKSLSSPLEGLGDLFTGIGKSYAADALLTKANALYKVALAIGILAASIAVLTLIDQTKILSAIEVLGILAAGLVGVVALLSALPEKSASSLSFVALAASVYILVKALKQIGDLDPNKIKSGLGILSILVAEMTVVAIALNMSAGPFSTGALTLIAFAISIKLLVGVLKDLCEMDLLGVDKSLYILTRLAFVMATMARASAGVGAGAGIGLLAMVIAMKILIGSFDEIANLDIQAIKDNIESFAIVFGLMAALIISSKLAGNNAAQAGVMMILIAAAILVLVQAMKQIAEIDPEGLDQALGAIIKLEAMFAVLMVASAFAKKGSGTIIALTVAIGVMALALAGLSFVDPEGLKNATVALSIVIGMFSLLVASSGLSKKAAGTLASMIVVVTILAGIIIALSLIDSDAAIKSALAISIPILALSTSLLMISKVDGITKKAKQGLYALAGIMAIIAAVLIAMALLDVEASLENAAAISLVLIAISASLLIASQAKELSNRAIGGLYAMAGVTAIVAAILGVLAYLDLEASIQSAISIGILINALAAAFLIASQAKELADGAIAGLYAMAGVTAIVAAILGVLAYLDLEASIQSAISIGILINALAAAFLIASQAKSISASAIAGLYAMSGVTAILAVILGVLAKLDIGLSIETALSLSVLLVALSAACLILSKIQSIGPGALEAIGVMVLIIAAVGGILVALGELNKMFDNLGTFLDTGISLLSDIGYALGSFIGNVIGGFTEGAAKGLVAVGKALADFMKAVKPFFEGMREYGSEALEGIGILVGAILAITAADVLNGLTSWFTGKSSLEAFGDDLVAFAPKLKEFSDSISGENAIDINAIKNAIEASKLLAKLQKSLYGEGGLKQLLLGEKDWSSLGDNLTDLGKALVDYSSVISGDAIDVNAIRRSATAAGYLAELQSFLYGEGGWLQIVLGEKDLSSFGGTLVAFGKALAEYSSTVSGEGKIDIDAIELSVTAAGYISDLQSSLYGEGGLKQILSGEKDLSTFGDNLAAFGGSLVKYSSAITEGDGIDIKAMENSAKAAGKLAELESNLTSIETIFDFFNGRQDLSTFGEHIASFGGSLKVFSDSISGENALDMAAIINAIAAAKKLADLESSLTAIAALDNSVTIVDFGSQLTEFSTAFVGYSDKMSTKIDYGKLGASTSQLNNIIEAFSKANSFTLDNAKNFVNYLSSVASDSINKFIDTFGHAYDQIKKAGSDMMSTFAEGVTGYINGKEEDTSIKGAFDKALDLMIKCIEDNRGEFNFEGQCLMTYLYSGIVEKKDLGAIKVQTVVDAIIAQIKSNFENFKTTGKNVMNYFYNGIVDKIALISSGISRVMGSVIGAIESSYTDFYNAGANAASGFTNGLSGTDDASSAGSSLGSAAITGAREALNEHSPSKEFYHIGYYGKIAFIQSLLDGIPDAFRAGLEIAKSAKDGLQNGIKNAYEYINGNVGDDIVIRPILDLSEIQNGVKSMRGILGRSGSYEISGTVAKANEVSAGITQTARYRNTEVSENSGSDSSLNQQTTFNNTFNISGSDPKANAKEVSHELQRQIGRKDAAWA